MKSIVVACALSVLCIAPLPGQIRRPAANGASMNQTTQIINDLRELGQFVSTYAGSGRASR